MEGGRDVELVQGNQLVAGLGETGGGGRVERGEEGLQGGERLATGGFALGQAQPSPQAPRLGLVALAQVAEEIALFVDEAALDDCYWFADYLGDLDALLDALSPGQAVDLIGHSMGGNVVMSYAGVRPERVRRLVNLEGFSLPQTRAEHTPKRLRQWLDELAQPQSLHDYASLDEVAARLMKTNPRLAAAKAAWLAGQWSAQRDDGRWHILGDAAHKRINPVTTRAEDTIALWSRIRAPLLWVEGDSRDFERKYGERYTREQFEQRLAAVPSVRKLQLTPAGHMLHHDQPEALARALQEFLDPP